ncbi:unnamed protein product [Ambrosiozyma monospora]|uniref:Unnamed protein product n=1 Tax=Ambrosiozyma monospora TaxID=43982 RepID=A0A9W6Z655_AMBMO|nr:unnamed protein product [Ambrosiozyma monospora]
MTTYNYRDYVSGGLLNRRYRRVRDINEGSFGIVSLAKDTSDNKLVALKYNTATPSDFSNFNDKENHNENDESSKYPAISKSVIVRETKHEVSILKKVSKHPNITGLLDHFDTCH